MEILHLEDDGPLREIMNIALSAADPNLNMTQFTDSDAAIDYIQANISSIALFLLDVRVPGALDGLGVAQKIRELGSTRPILVTSAYRKPDQDKMTAYNCKWMAKPWHLLDAPTTILDLARKDSSETPPKQEDVTSPSVSEVIRPQAKPQRETRSSFTQLPPSQRKTEQQPTTPKSYLEQLNDIKEADTHAMEAVQLPDDIEIEPTPINEAQSPLPFDETPAVQNTPVQEWTDMIVTLAQQENEQSNDETDEKNQLKEEPTVYKSDDAPQVEPFENSPSDNEN